MDVSENSGTTPNHPSKNMVFHDFHHPFWGTPIFGNTEDPRLSRVLSLAKSLFSASSRSPESANQKSTIRVFP